MLVDQEEIDALLEKVQERFQSILSTKNVDKILDEYHPNAVVIHRGLKAIYGRDELHKFFEQILKECNSEYKIVPSKNSATPDGEYLFQEGYIEILNDGKKYSCLGVFKKSTDGTYKYYRDEVNMKPLNK